MKTRLRADGFGLDGDGGHRRAAAAQAGRDGRRCVVGAGIAGITTAYLLTREGKQVVLLDDGPVGGGKTCRTTAHLVFYNDDGLTKIEQLHGTEGLRLATESHSAAVDRIQRSPAPRRSTATSTA